MQVKKTPVAQPSESESSDDHMSVYDNSDESINLGQDTFGSGICMDEPEINSWVGVKLEKATASKGRKRDSFETYLARVTKVDVRGYEVSFLKEKFSDFYIMPEVEELSYPHHRNELVVLETPNTECRNQVYDFVFPPAVKSVVHSYFKQKLM